MNSREVLARAEASLDIDQVAADLKAALKHGEWLPWCGAIMDSKTNSGPTGFPEDPAGGDGRRDRTVAEMAPRDGEQCALAYADIMETGDEDNAECAAVDHWRRYPIQPCDRFPGPRHGRAGRGTGH